VLYADVDGTLVGPGGSLFATGHGPSARAALAIAALHEAEVELVLVSGRTREQLREAARLLGAAAFIAELGAFVVERGPDEEVTTNFGAFSGTGTPFAAMARSGAGAFLLERFEGRLEPHTPWAFRDREATMLFRGFVDEREASEALVRARYGWLEVCDNGRISRVYESLDVPEVRAYHLVPRGVNKASAVKVHRERRGLPLEQTAAVGDSASDLHMAPEVGAMALVGASESQIEAADGAVFTTERAGGEGFAETVEILLGRDL
jgi:phosphoglycolate phosphatase